MPIWGKQLPEADSDTRQMAGNMASMVSAYIDAGFTREEAIQIVTNLAIGYIKKEQ
ncbi:hypothetical protein [uncultured Corynebacterium sp.]|uniref:hypothetical protein n=1 Tax=uncultured Corynebacterium sp. TaxID=159447 RepID=UPI0025DAB8A0|nr:hypothetical protein [uncultured Corynebacterium sp.]